MGARREVKERVDRLGIKFNAYGLDQFGLSRDYLVKGYLALYPFYRHYFRVRAYGLDHVPDTGRAMLIGNHSGGVPVDGAMVSGSLFFDRDRPRHTHGMVEKIFQRFPVVSTWAMRVGMFPGLPQNARRFLEDDRVLMAFPEGARGTGKLYKDRYNMVRFGSGFMRLALQTKTPVVPFAFIGGEEALPQVYQPKFLAKLLNVPYVPIPPYLVPVPLPVACQIYYGEPMEFVGAGRESDEVIGGYVRQVRKRIDQLILKGRRLRHMQGDQEGAEDLV